jgi:hypothetical protein
MAAAKMAPPKPHDKSTDAQLVRYQCDCKHPRCPIPQGSAKFAGSLTQFLQHRVEFGYLDAAQAWTAKQSDFNSFRVEPAQWRFAEKTRPVVTGRFAEGAAVSLLIVHRNPPRFAMLSSLVLLMDHVGAPVPALAGVPQVSGTGPRWRAQRVLDVQRVELARQSDDRQEAAVQGQWLRGDRGLLAGRRASAEDPFHLSCGKA